MRKLFHIAMLLLMPVLAFGETMTGLHNKANLEEVTCDFNLTLNSGTNLEFCYNDRNSVFLQLEVDNSGSDTLLDYDIGWRVRSDLFGTSQGSDPISPGGVAMFTIPVLTFSGDGLFQVKTWVTTYCNGVAVTADTLVINVNIRSPFEVHSLKDTTICANSSTVLSVPNGIGSVLWSTGETSVSILAHVSSMYTVLVTDGFGCYANDTMDLANYDVPDDILDDTILCDGVILSSGTGIGVGYNSYLWSNGEITSTIQISSSGKYWVSVVDSNSCLFSDTMEVQYATLPTPGTPSILEVCEGDTAILSASSNFTSYSWSTGATTSSIPIYSSGTYVITVIGVQGCVGIDTVIVSVLPLPVIAFNDSVMCNNAVFVLESGQWYPNMQWSTGDTTSNILITNPGMYSVSVTDGFGCHSFDSIEIININLDVNLGPDAVVCGGLVLYPSGNYDSYMWSSGSTAAGYSVSQSGVYSVTVTKDVCIAIDEVVVTIESAPVADFVSSVSSPWVQFTNMSSATYNVVWDFGDGNYSSSIDPGHQYATYGNYIVNLKVTNSCGVDSIQENIGIYPQGVGNIYLNSSLKLFPTVAESQIQFTIDEANINQIEYRVYDAVGKILISNKDTYFGPDYVYRINVSQFAAGFYFLRITNEEELLGVKQFVKQ